MKRVSIMPCLVIINLQNFWDTIIVIRLHTKVFLLLCAAVDRLNPNDLGWAFPAGLPSPQAGWAGAPPETTMHINAITLQIWWWGSSPPTPRSRGPKHKPIISLRFAVPRFGHGKMISFPLLWHSIIYRRNQSLGTACLLTGTDGSSNKAQCLFCCETKVYVQNKLEPSSGILHHYYLTRGSTLTSQDYSPSSVVYAPELIRAI